MICWSIQFFNQEPSNMDCSNNSLRLAIIVALFCFKAHCQILKSNREYAWIDPVKTTGAISPSSFVGNYPILKADSTPIPKILKMVAAQNSGTIFMVIKPSVGGASGVTPGKQLMRLGKISLYKDSLLIDGQHVDIKPIKDKPVIIKVVFQGRPQRWAWLSRKYEISEEIKLSELVSYDRLLDQHQCRLVESFLALKYSINITANSDPGLRDYYSLNDKKVWDVKTDGLYDEEVMGLGRMDRVGFYQSQTLTSDSKKIMISLDPTGKVGAMPFAFIQDSSLMVLSKRNPQVKMKCGGTSSKYLWKLKSFNWVSNAQFMWMTIDSTISFSNLVLTDGQSVFPVNTFNKGTKTVLKVPISQLQDGVNYFIEESSGSSSCNRFYNLAIHSCDSTGSGNALINLTNLPVHVQLANLTTGSYMDTSVSSPYIKIAGLESGQYELLLRDSTELLLDSIFVLQGCDTSAIPSEFSLKGTVADEYGSDRERVATDWKVSTLNGSNSGDVSGNDQNLSGLVNLSNRGNPGDLVSSNSKAISIYPNPASRAQDISFDFYNLKNECFTVQVMDSKGALIKEDKFTPVSKQSEYHYSFSLPGTYIVRIFSNTFFYVQQVVIKSASN